MLEELKGKRLLVLGGTAWADIIFSFAKENNIHLITTGKNPSKLFDEYYYVDSIDSKAMKNLIKEKKIDGVYIGSNERVIRQAIQYLPELDLPCYCTLQQWDTLMNKLKFKKLCRQFDLPVVETYEWTPTNKCKINYPVIVKPTNGCASAGIKICYSETELIEGYRLAYENSASHEVLIEQLVNNSGMDVFFQITDYEIEFCGLGDKYSVQLADGAGSVAGARILPSVFTDEFRFRFEKKIKAMFSSINLKHGLIWMEVFHDGDDYYFNEVGYRLNGSLTIISVDYFCGINAVAADMYFALTGKSKAKGFNSLILKKYNKKKKKICEYWIACKSGIISKIDGLNKLNLHPNILAIFPKYSIGSLIPQTNGFAQNFCVIHFMYDTNLELNEIISFIKSNIRVIDENGCDMIIHKSDQFTKKLFIDNK